MRSIWRIGRIKGIDINIDPSWLIIFGLITFSLGGVYFPRVYPRWPHWLHLITGLITSILFFASVLGHELAHSLVAIRQGEKVRSITLFILVGGAAEITEEPDRPRKEFLVAIVGSLSSLGIALMFMGLWLLLRPINEPASAVARYLAFINIVLAIFNLIPGFPMDGGEGAALHHMGDYRQLKAGHPHCFKHRANDCIFTYFWWPLTDVFWCPSWWPLVCIYWLVFASCCGYRLSSGGDARYVKRDKG